MTNRTSQPQTETTPSETTVLSGVEQIYINKEDEEGDMAADHHFVAQCKQIWDMRSWIEREQSEVPDVTCLLREHQSPPYIYSVDCDTGDNGFHEHASKNLASNCDNTSNPNNAYKNHCQTTTSSSEVNLCFCPSLYSEAKPPEQQPLSETVSSHDGRTNYSVKNNIIEVTPSTSSPGKGFNCSSRNGILRMFSLDKTSFESSDGPSSESSMDNKNIKASAELSSSIEMSAAESFSSNQSLAGRFKKDLSHVHLPKDSSSLITHRDETNKTSRTSTNNSLNASSTSSSGLSHQGVLRQLSSETDSLVITRDTALEYCQLDRDYAIDATTYQIYKSFLKQDPYVNRRLARRFRRNDRQINYPIATTKAGITNSTENSIPVLTSDVTLINTDRCNLNFGGTELDTIAENMTGDGIKGNKVLGNPTVIEQRGRFLRCFRLMGQARKDSIEEETEEDLEENPK